MNEQDIIFKVISDLQDALPPPFTVRTRGGDSGAKPPLCLVGWNARRLPTENGHNSFGGVIRDEITGDATGRELHEYKRMELDVSVRAYDEGDRDMWLSDVEAAFLPYEYDASRFHDDTTEWEIGDTSPTSTPVVEPDWYESELAVGFKYVKRVADSDDPLTTVQGGSNGGVYVDETLDD